MKIPPVKKNILNIEFTCDGLLLRGKLHLPETKHPNLVVGSHGLEGSKDSAKQRILADLLVKNGMAFFRFDHRGCGQSQGDFIKDTSLETRTRDFICAIHHVTGFGKTSKNIAIFGSSMGGATCINSWDTILQMDINLCGAVLCSAPVKSRSIENIPTEANDTRPALPISFFEKNLLFDITKKAGDLSNVLIFHGNADDVVPVSNAHDIFGSAKDPKHIIIHKDGDHQMTSRTDQIEFEKETVSWFLNCFSSQI